MGLDVYVGSFTRYLAGDWELATQTAAREMGLKLEVVRTNQPDDAVTDVGEIREAVLAWREQLAQAVELPLEWPEHDQTPYFTDKPDWSGYAALLFLAAHSERPEIPLPVELPENPFAHELLESVIGGQKRGLLRRRNVPDRPPRYASLYTAEVWLPVETDGVWTAPFVTGQSLTMASTQTLLADLRDLARRIGVSNDDLEAARASGGFGESLGTVEMEGQVLEQMAPAAIPEMGRFGLAVFLELAERAVEHGLPMKLDY